MSAITARRRAHSPGHGLGFGLVELLIAVVIGSLVAAAATSVLIVARRGFATVDAASQLKDNARFATDVLQRTIAQAGLVDVHDAIGKRRGALAPSLTDPAPSVFGFNNALFPGTSPPTPEDPLHNTRSGAAGCPTSTDSACKAGSDILVVAYQTPATVAGGKTADRTTLSCFGTAQDQPSLPGTSTLSVFHVKPSTDGEPNLMCSYFNASGVWVTLAAPLVAGVESFQVLYGVDGVTAGAPTAAGATEDMVADRYLRSDQLLVAGHALETRNNWRRVRSVRIGMVLRGPPNSAQDIGAGLVYHPLGATLGSPADMGSQFDAPSDGRLRQTVTFTVSLRNDQGL